MGRGGSLTELFDKLTKKGGELVPVGREPEAGASGSGSGSPFDRFLDGLHPGEPPDDDFTRALLYAALGSGLALVGALILALLPSGDSIRESSFLLVGKITTGNMMDTAGGLAVPLLVTSLTLLAITGLLWIIGNRGGVGAAVCAVQPGVGMVAVCGAAIPWLILIAVFVTTLAIYVFLAWLVLRVLGAE